MSHPPTTAEAPPVTRATAPILIAIGSSANGVQNLRAILSALPADFPGTVLIVQHRSRTARSILGPLLARNTKLIVKDAVDGEAMNPGTVYIAPVGRHLVVRDGHAALVDTAPVNFARPSVDVLFETIAKVYGERAVGVILSGAGRDGARGLQAIRRAGGHTIVQSPAEARLTGMPQSAIGKDGIEFVLDVSEIGPLLRRLVASKEIG